MDSVKKTLAAKYSILCQELGDLSYKIKQMKERKVQIESELKALNAVNASINTNSKPEVVDEKEKD